MTPTDAPGLATVGGVDRKQLIPGRPTALARDRPSFTTTPLRVRPAQKPLQISQAPETLRFPMSDFDYRRLQRAEHHDPTSAARALVARVRVGELDEQDLALAAHLGHEPARLALALPRTSSPWTAPSTTVQSAVEELQPFGRGVLVLAAVTAVELALGPEPSEPVDRELTVAARAWLGCPCDDHVHDARDLLQNLAVNDCNRGASAARFACHAVVEELPAAARCAGMAVRSSLVSVNPRTEATVTAFRDSLRSKLIAWSLRRREVRSRPS